MQGRDRLLAKTGPGADQWRRHPHPHRAADQADDAGHSIQVQHRHRSGAARHRQAIRSRRPRMTFANAQAARDEDPTIFNSDDLNQMNSQIQQATLESATGPGRIRSPAGGRATRRRMSPSSRRRLSRKNRIAASRRGGLYPPVSRPDRTAELRGRPRRARPDSGHRSAERLRPGHSAVRRRQGDHSGTAALSRRIRLQPGTIAQLGR